MLLLWLMFIFFYKAVFPKRKSSIVDGNQVKGVVWLCHGLFLKALTSIYIVFMLPMRLHFFYLL